MTEFVVARDEYVDENGERGICIREPNGKVLVRLSIDDIIDYIRTGSWAAAYVDHVYADNVTRTQQVVICVTDELLRSEMSRLSSLVD